MFDTSVQATTCPYCGEAIKLVVDQSVGDQEYIEDCEVCCRPMVLHVMVPAGGDPVVMATSEND